MRAPRPAPGLSHHRAVRIVSLLPSATEIVYALGLGGQLVAVTFECNFPPRRARSRSSPPRRSPSTARAPARSTPRSRRASPRGEPRDRLDTELIRTIDPDVILTQDLCRVCAVPSGDVEAALGVIGCRAEVVSLDPSSLDEVIACVGAVG